MPVAAWAQPDSDHFLDDLQKRTFGYFWETSNPENGLTPDRWPRESFSSVAAVGFALTAYPIGVENGYVTIGQARERTVTTLRFLWEASQGPDEKGTTGYRGFFYHFLDMDTGLRFEKVELSTIDTALLMGGVLFAREYYDDEEIRSYADSLYERVEWTWAQPRAPLIGMGWHPERGFIQADYRGYDEAMLLYVLALGSPSHPVASSAWTAFTETNEWDRYFGQEHVNFGPLFGHQYSHIWIDFRGVQDEFMRSKGIDYFENSRRATISQRNYAIDNPNRWNGYSGEIWGLTASDGPKDTTMVVDGVARRFHTYWARGASADGVSDDGTISPTAAGGSVPFASDIAIPALMAMREAYGDHIFGKYGFLDAFNPTFTMPVSVQHGKVVPELGWFDTDYLGIDQGPILAMVENHRSELIWKTMRESEPIVRGMCRAGFRGGWLAGKCHDVPGN
ncbi:MAG: glucoamylase family protein [Rhodothermales bacterium]